MTVRNLVQICYGVPGISLYSLVLWALISLRKQLSRSFLVIYCLLIFSVRLSIINDQISILEHYYVAELMALPQVDQRATCLLLLL